MHQLLTKKYFIKQNESLPKVLAHSIYQHAEHGKIVIVTNKPISLMYATRRHWVNLIRQAKREHSSTLTFTARPPKDLLDASVTFATAEDLIKAPPICRTAFFTYSVDSVKQHLLTS